MHKTLKATFQKNCIGCELCVAEVQRQLGKVGLEDAPIRILRESKDGKLTFSVDIDPTINQLDVEKIKNVCPALVFIIDEDEDSNELTH